LNDEKRLMNLYGGFYTLGRRKDKNSRMSPEFLIIKKKVLPWLF